MVERLGVFVKRQAYKGLSTPYEVVNNVVFTDTSGMGRINRVRQFVTALFRYERLEMSYGKSVEVRGYVERLMQEALKNGPTHKPTMELMDFWMLEKDLIHKVFKVYVPRYQKFEPPYSKLHHIPSRLPGHIHRPRTLLEMKGNPYPPVETRTLDMKSSLANILLTEAKREYYKRKVKAEEERAQLGPQFTEEPRNAFT